MCRADFWMGWRLDSDGGKRCGAVVLDDTCRDVMGRPEMVSDDWGWQVEVVRSVGSAIERRHRCGAVVLKDTRRDAMGRPEMVNDDRGWHVEAARRRENALRAAWPLGHACGTSWWVSLSIRRWSLQPWVVRGRSIDGPQNCAGTSPAANYACGIPFTNRGIT
jgi:hypothetical protein